MVRVLGLWCMEWCFDADSPITACRLPQPAPAVLLDYLNKVRSGATPSSRAGCRKHFRPHMCNPCPSLLAWPPVVPMQRSKTSRTLLSMCLTTCTRP